MRPARVAGKIMGRWNAAILVLAVLTAPPARSADEPLPERERLRKHIEVLASPEFGGRRGEVAQKSRQYLIDRFKELKLEPLFGDTYYQDVPGVEPGTVGGRNVGAKLIGSDPALKNEWIIVGTHFDHLGRRGQVHYPGADDNASGVAMMLETARSIVESPEKPKRSIMIIGFDMEELGLWGSRYFAEHSPVPLSQVKLFVTADMIGRSLGGVCTKHVFVMGSEHGPWVRPVLARFTDPARLTLGTLGADVLLIDRSDYGPFRHRRIPFLFFSTGENPDYHRITDRADTIDYPKTEAISRLIHGVIKDALVRPTIPGWSTVPEHPIEEVLTIREVFKIMLEHGEELKISGAQSFIMRGTLRTLDAIAERKTYHVSERPAIIRVAQGILATVF